LLVVLGLSRGEFGDSCGLTLPSNRAKSDLEYDRLVCWEQSSREKLSFNHNTMASNNTSPESQPPNREQSSQELQIRPQHPFYLLPAELILDIIDLLPPEAFINFAFANYPFLHASGLAPALSRIRINYIQDNTRIPALFPLFRIPAEITLEIMHHLKPIDLMRFVMANYQDLARQGITPPLTEDTLRQLRIALGSDMVYSR
jgi:hypothetical protein